MGFLDFGVPLHWVDSLAHTAYVRRHGIEQFIAMFHKVKGRVNDVLKWGDEVRPLHPLSPALSRAPLTPPPA